MPAGDCATTDVTEAIESVLEQGMKTEDVLAVKSEDRGSVVGVGKLVVLDSGKADATGAGLVVPVDNLTAGRGITGSDAMVFVAKTRAGLPSGRMGDVTKADVPATGEGSARPPCSCGRADTNFVTLGIKEELRDWAPTNRTGVKLCAVGSTGNPTVGVRTATGDLRAGTLGI